MNDGVLKYGDSSFSAVDASRENFAGASITAFSTCCTPIELPANDGSDRVLATASGFFWVCDGRPYLVTNWHVLSGRNVFTGEAISKFGFVPQSLIFYGVKLEMIGPYVEISRTKYHQKFDEQVLSKIDAPPEIDGVPVDIMALPLPDGVVLGRDDSRTGFKGANSFSGFLNEFSTKPIVTTAGDDCFILGYPLKNYNGFMPPVWKRGSIASDTNIGVDGKPIFLVDASTTPSMSGSPILRKATTFTADNRDIGAIQEFAAYDIIGVYAGRLQNAEMERVGLGYGWYRTLIDKVIRSLNFGPVYLR